MDRQQQGYQMLMMACYVPEIHKELTDFYMLHIGELGQQPNNLEWVSKYIEANNLKNALINGYTQYCQSTMAQMAMQSTPPAYAVPTPSYSHSSHSHSQTKYHREYREKNSEEEKAREDKTREDKTREDKVREDKTREDKVRDDKAKEVKVRQDLAREDKAREDKARDDKAKDDKTKEDKAKEDRAREAKLAEEELRRKEQEESQKLLEAGPRSWNQIAKIVQDLREMPKLAGISKQFQQMMEKYNKRAIRASTAPFQDLNKKDDRKGRQQNRQYTNTTPTQFERGTKFKPQVVVEKGIYRSVQSAEVTSLRESLRTDKDMVQQLQEKAKTDEDKFRREAKFQLNLLTPENFDAIKREAQTLVGEGDTACKVLIEELIYKAWSEPKYCSTYAKLCVHLKQSESFKQCLISNVENYFTKKNFKMIPTEKDSEEYKAELKKKFIGNIKFIGELINVKVIIKRVAYICFLELFQAFLEDYAEDRPGDELSLEGMIVIIEKSGKFLESKEKDSSTPFDQVLISQTEAFVKNKKPQKLAAMIRAETSPKISLPAVFAVLGALSRFGISNRLKALMKNLIERKEKGWSEVTVSKGPMTIRQLHQSEQPESKEKKLTMEELKRSLRNHFQTLMSEDSYRNMLRLLTHLTNVNKDREVLDALLLTLPEVRVEFAPLRKHIVLDFVQACDIPAETFVASWKANIKKLATYKSEFLFMASLLAHNISSLMAKKGWPRIQDLSCYVDTENEEEEEFIDLIKEVMAKLVLILPDRLEEANKLLLDMGIGDTRIEHFSKRVSASNHI